jgi:hypothetical protein
VKPQPRRQYDTADDAAGLSCGEFEAIRALTVSCAQRRIGALRQREPTKIEALIDEVRVTLDWWFLHQEFERGSFAGPAPWQPGYSRRDDLRAVAGYNARFWRLTVDFNRWRAVYLARCQGMAWDDAYDAASASYNRPDFAGSPRTMKRGYQRVQRVVRDAGSLSGPSL